jgi:hypothetical protein
MRWFKQHLLLAAVFGAIGGPLAFLAGERLGGVEFTSYPAPLTLLAVGWGLLMPLMMLLARRFNGFDNPPQTASASAAQGG